MKAFNFLVLILFLNTQVLAGEAADHDDFTNLSDDILLNSVWSETKFMPLQLSFFHRG